MWMLIWGVWGWCEPHSGLCQVSRSSNMSQFSLPFYSPLFHRPTQHWLSWWSPVEQEGIWDEFILGALSLLSMEGRFSVSLVCCLLGGKFWTWSLSICLPARLVECLTAFGLGEAMVSGEEGWRPFCGWVVSVTIWWSFDVFSSGILVECLINEFEDFWKVEITKQNQDWLWPL